MASLQPGQMLGQYQITSQIGKGGMATVYKAYQVSMDRYVALKVVSGQVMDDPNFLKRFRQEARLIAKLEHPHILPVHDYGEEDGMPYMVMRFLEAGTLTELLETGPLPLSEIDRIFTQLTDALEYAHENGVIHRDIKPSNAMLDKRGGVFLTDFGIAKMVEGASPGLTATGAITGTPSYMSPEQAQGNKVDQRSDIYSLGIVLFEMLTGRVPFEAETPMAVLFKQILDPPPPLSTVRADLPYTLEIVLLKALAKKPEDRYPSMAAFRTGWKKALSEFAEVASTQQMAVPKPQLATPIGDASTSPTVVPLATAVGAAVKSDGKKKVPLLVIIGVCVVVVALLGGAVVFGGMYFLGRMSQVQPTPTMQDNILAEPPLNAGSTSVVVSASEGTKSWAAANSVFSIDFRGKEVLTAGFGGVTIWNRDDGSYKRITTADGLPGANTGLVFVDQDQSLWVGSDSGLTHFRDGTFIVYTVSDGLDSNAVGAITRNNKGLLVGTQYSGQAGGGLLSLEDGSWKPVPGFPSASAEPDEKSVSYNVRKIVEDKDGNLWVATDNGLAMLNTNNQWTVFKTQSGLADNNVYVVDVNPQGKVFVGTANGNVAQFDAEKGRFESYVDLKEYGIYDVCCMQIGADQSEWFAGGNIVRYTPQTKQWTTYSADTGSFPAYSVTSMGMDDQGTLYFGSDESGLVRYVNNKFERMVIPNAPSYGQYGRIVHAQDGRLVFMQLYDNGGDLFDPATETWNKVPAEQHLPRAFDSKGRMWSGGWDGLWIFEDGKITHVTEEHGLPSTKINAIVFDSKGLAYLATGTGIVTFDGLTVKDTYTTKDGLIADDVLRLFMAKDDSLWVSMTGGFSHRLADGTWEHFTAEKLFGGYAAYFTDFVEDSDGNIWISTIGDGVYQYANGKWKRLRATDPGVGLPSDTVNAAALAPDGSLWFGTENEGAVRYDGKTWTRYTVAEGLIHNTVNGIYVAPDGVVWFATNGGMTKLVP